jgi:hypothetical protein
MDHPAVLKCAARTAECSRQSLELNNRSARRDGELMELLSNSRHAVARSRQLLILRDFRERDAK